MVHVFIDHNTSLVLVSTELVTVTHFILLILAFAFTPVKVLTKLNVTLSLVLRLVFAEFLMSLL